MMAAIVTAFLLPPAQWMADGETPSQQVAVNVQDYAELAEEGDWSPAIQAAIDSFSSEESPGGTIVLPPGVYRVSSTIRLGTGPGQWGLHMVGYGATLLATAALDAQEWSDVEPEEAEHGPPIMVVQGPGGREGASFTIEGLTFDREQRHGGVGVSVPWSERVPKNTTFRSVRFLGQKVGVHINHSWQVFFAECLFRGNDVGMIIQNHGNNIGITNCTFRRNHHHGLVIGPDRGQWASNGQHISGSIFEANKGYGILLLDSAQTVIAGSYFEANGNHIGVRTPWQTTIDTNLFWGYYGHGWRRNDFSDNACIVVQGARRLRLRNNHYAAVSAWFRRPEDGQRWEYVPVPEGPVGVKEHAPPEPEQQPGFEYAQRPVPILIAGRLDGDFVFDALPEVHHEATTQTTRIAKDTWLAYYEYNPGTNRFEERSLLPQEQ
ncbi:MAG: right-handed parallel beta-helix repeat-containing protein [Armatimonadota bacterium]|nr:right-handed parallel beta-helix repeat-containing protein [Armatimonadota bacterium]